MDFANITDKQLRWIEQRLNMRPRKTNGGKITMIDLSQNDGKPIVVLLVSSLDVGGLERYLIRFLRDSKGQFRPVVICKHGRAGVLAPFAEENGGQVIPLALPLFPIANYLRYLRLLKSLRPVSICDFTGDFSAISLIMARIAGVERRICFYRGSEYQFAKSHLRMVYVRLLNLSVSKFATRILSNSETALDRFHPGWRRKASARVIRNDVAVQELTEGFDKTYKRTSLGIPPSAFLVTHVGRFVPAKNHAFLVKLACEIYKRDPRVLFLLVGPRVPDGLAQLSTESVGPKSIISLGVRDDISEILSVSDLFVFPSLNEGMPNALLEAVARGVPIVANDIPSIREVLPENLHEDLLHVELDSWVKKILTFAASDRSDSRHARAAKAVREEFAPEIVFEEFRNELGVVNHAYK